MLFRHTAFYFVANALPALVNFFALALYTRLLIPSEYGYYGLVVAGVGIANSTIFWWLRLSLVRFFAIHENRRAVFLSTIAVCFIALVGLAAISGAVTLILFRDSAFPRLIALGLGVLCVQAWFELNLELIRSRLAPFYYGMLSVTRSFLVAAVGIALASAGFGAQGLLVGLVIGNILPTLIVTKPLWRDIKPGLVDSLLIRELLTFGLPLAAKFVSDLVIIFSGRFFLAGMIGATPAGLYALSFDLAQQSVGLLITIVYLAAFPLIVSTLEREGIHAGRQKMTDYGTLLLAVACPAALGLALLAENIAEVVLGEAFKDSVAEIIPWVAAIAFLAGIKAHHFDLGFQLKRNTIPQIWIGVLAAIVCVSLNLLLIPDLGILGAVAATLGAYLVSVSLSWWLGSRMLELSFFGRNDLKVVLATACMWLALAPLLSYRGPVSLIIQIAFGGVVYLAGLTILNVLNIRTALIRRIGALF